MGQALYRKYRSKRLADIVGQEHITMSLRTALKNGKISHAYLFTGPRGVGKTSIARILAHEINELPYDDDTTYIDIIEIDAASNRRIDEIRELREQAFIAPTAAKYKVYIIDEVHMLTKEAFNALLKLLEEPPKHVIFILATTDAHKLPETIISRTQRYSFKPATEEEVISLLQNIAEKEHIKASNDALGIIAQHGGGSFRDSIGILDQARNYSEDITENDILQLLGVPSNKAISDLYQDIFSQRDITKTIGNLNNLYKQGFQAPVIAKSLGKLLRDTYLKNAHSPDADNMLMLLSNLIGVPASIDPERALEVVLLKAINPQSKNSQAVQETVTDSLPSHEPAKPQQSKNKVEPSIDKQHEPELPKAKIQKQVEVPSSDGVQESDVDFNNTEWANVLTALKKKHNTVYSIVRMAKPVLQEHDVLILSFGFDFHAKRMSEAKNQQLLNSVLKEITGKDYKITSTVNKSADTDNYNATEFPESPSSTGSTDLTAISNIFGGGELLES